MNRFSGQFPLDGAARYWNPVAMSSAAAQAMQPALDTFRPRACTMGRACMFADKSIGLDDPGMLALAEPGMGRDRPNASASWGHRDCFR